MWVFFCAFTYVNLGHLKVDIERFDFIHHLVFPWETALKTWAVLDQLHNLSVCHNAESIKGAEFCIILFAFTVFSIPFALSALTSEHEVSSYDNDHFAWFSCVVNAKIVGVIQSNLWPPSNTAKSVKTTDLINVNSDEYTITYHNNGNVCYPDCPWNEIKLWRKELKFSKQVSKIVLKGVNNGYKTNWVHKKNVHCSHLNTQQKFWCEDA